MPTWGKVLLGCGGGCLTLVLLFVILGAVGFRSLSSSSPLTTFPHYPGSSQTNVSYNRNSAPGTSNDRLTLTTPDSSESVLAYYRSHLDGNGWALDSGAAADDTQLRFHRASHPSERGTMTVIQSSQRSLIEVQYQY